MRKTKIFKYAGGLILGVIGAFFNAYPVNLGWGLDVIFGQALVVAGFRILSSAQFVGASMISSSITLLLWHHPWAWIIWALEATTLAAFGRKWSLAALDAAFWLLLGAPLLLLTYGAVMGMEAPDLVLVITKQAANGILNVALGELGYLAFYVLRGRRRVDDAKLPIETVVSSSLVALCAIPLLVFMRVAAGETEYALRQYATASADAGIEGALRQIQNGGTTLRGSDHPALDLHGQTAGGLQGAQATREQSVTVYRQKAGQVIHVSGPSSIEVNQETCSSLEPGATTFFTATAFGTPKMTSLRSGLMIKCVEINGDSEKLVAVVKLEREISKIRESQAVILSVVIFLFILIILVVHIFVRSIQGAIDRLIVRARTLSISEVTYENPDRPANATAEFFNEIENLANKFTLVTMEVASQQNRLRAAHLVLQSVANSAPIGIYSSDLGQHICGGTVEFSVGVERLLGLAEQGGSRPWRWKDLIHPADLERVLADKGALPQSGHISTEYRLLHRDGKYVWVLDSASVELNTSSGALQIIGVLLDVSARKRTEQQLLHADKMASLGRMAVGIAHEVNQPLHIIRMAVSNLSRALRSGSYSEDVVMHKINLISSQVDRGAAIIRQMKLYGQFPSEDITLINVNKAIKSVVDIMSPLLEEAIIKPSYQSNAENPMIAASPIAFEQILINLVENATDAVASARQKGRNASKIHIELKQSEDWITVGVEDDGGGIPASIADLVFEPFFTTKPPIQGTGLGLSIAYGIAKSLGGDLTFESVPGGVRFNLRLPVGKGSR